MSKYEPLIRKLIETGEKLTVRQIADRLGCNRGTVYRVINKYGLEPVVRRLYTIDRDVFKELTPETAWLLGFIFADGGISGNSLKIYLRDTDQEVLYKARELFGSDSPIKLRYSVKDQNWFAGLLITNEEIITTLREVYGCGEAKTHSITYPDLPTGLNRHFIRGYFDGDGGVSESAATKSHWSTKVKFHITSNEKFLNRLQDIMVKECGLSYTKLQTRHPERQNNIRTMEYSGNQQGKAIFDYLYAGSGKWKLQRKYDKFKSILGKAPKNSPIKTKWEDWEIDYLIKNGSRSTSELTGRTMNSTVGKLASLKRKGLLQP